MGFKLSCVTTRAGRRGLAETGIFSRQKGCFGGDMLLLVVMDNLWYAGEYEANEEGWHHDDPYEYPCPSLLDFLSSDLFV
jgi:hypothetical protein